MTVQLDWEQREGFYVCVRVYICKTKLHIQETVCGSIAGNQSAKGVAVVGQEPRQVSEGSDYAKEYKTYPVGNEEISKGFNKGKMQYLGLKSNSSHDRMIEQEAVLTGKRTNQITKPIL